ncbi:MAG: hypothetical protein ACRC68_14855 [Clostridium sp.]
MSLSGLKRNYELGLPVGYIEADKTEKEAIDGGYRVSVGKEGGINVFNIALSGAETTYFLGKNNIGITPFAANIPIGSNKFFEAIIRFTFFVYRPIVREFNKNNSGVTIKAALGGPNFMKPTVVDNY